MSTLADILAVRALVEDDLNYSPLIDATEMTGNPVPPLSEEACRWTLFGAVLKVANWDRSRSMAMCTALNIINAPDWEERPHAEALNLLREAERKLRSDPLRAEPVAKAPRSPRRNAPRVQRR